jgi:hypothetical protein
MCSIYEAQHTAENQCAQEKPPEEDPHEGAHDDVVSTDPWPDEEMDENVESNFSALSSPQSGQGAFVSSLLNCMCSNKVPHLLHLNSYIGIYLSPSLSFGCY